MPDYDLAILGAGGAASEIAHYANGQGWRVVMVERDKLGGQCLNYGCDPTKSLLESARLAHWARRSGTLGIETGAVRVDMPAVQQSMRAVLDRMSGGGDIVQRLRDTGIDYVEGEGRLAGPGTITVNDRRISAREIVIATGTRAAVPDIAGLTAAGYITNIEAVSLEAVPARLAVIGGGPIGLEFAQMFRRLGSQVVLLEAADQIALTEEPEIRELLAQALRDEGIEIIEGAEIARMDPVEGGKRLLVSPKGVHPRTMVDMPLFDRERMMISEGIAAGARREIVVDEILVATGRRANIDGIGLEEMGVKTHAKGVVVDDRMATTVPHIWAAGDVTGMFQFTHMADYQARVLLANMVDGLDVRARYDAAPWCIFTDPEVAHVGKLASAVRHEGGSVFTTTFDLDELPRALTLREPHGRIKLVVDGSGKLLGANIMAPEAGTMLAGAVLAMRHGLTVHQLADTVLPYPTMGEGLRLACKQMAEKLLKV